MASIKVDYKVLGMVSTNCYFVCNEDSKEVLIIDPADQDLTIERYVEEHGYVPKAILLTHGHFDHILAADKVAKHYGIKIYAYQDELDLMSEPDLNLSTSFMGPFVVEADVALQDGQKITLAGLDITVIHTPGHTKGSCCYYFAGEGILISGDTLFFESVGRSDFPTGSTGVLLQSIKEKLFVLPDDTKVYPGHGSDTTIGYEKMNNCCVSYL